MDVFILYPLVLKLANMVEPAGFEPATNSLKGYCSTD